MKSGKADVRYIDSDSIMVNGKHYIDIKRHIELGSLCAEAQSLLAEFLCGSQQKKQEAMPDVKPQIKTKKDLAKATNFELETSLNKSIEIEDYRTCAIIQKEIDKRNKRIIKR